MDLKVHIVSDSTGDTAATIVNAVGVQFAGENIYLRRHFNIRNRGQIDHVVQQIQRDPGLVVYTMANTELAHYFHEICEAKSLTAIDLLGPLFNAFTRHFGVDRSQKMGAFHAVNDSYFKRIDAIEFTLRHDDNLNVKNLSEADLILVGVSRTSKTPVSMYLAIQHGLKVANVALALGLQPPLELLQAQASKVVGLTIQPSRLVEIRRARLGRLEVQGAGNYADQHFVFKELDMAHQLFKKNPRWPIIDVSDRSIEETATLILDKVFGRVRLMQSPKEGGKA
ncbi:MAG: kinase/pyrophosphorylase [Acidobacteria bacterium]|nr:kinase/pyrophosphorylase [Acidobacteriota bacterium]